MWEERCVWEERGGGEREGGESMCAWREEEEEEKEYVCMGGVSE